MSNVKVENPTNLGKSIPISMNNLPFDGEHFRVLLKQSPILHEIVIYKGNDDHFYHSQELYPNELQVYKLNEKMFAVG